jgi:hypothetical protein
MNPPNYLQLCGLGVDGPCQSPGAPALANGIHLRWGFAKVRGFPRGGFFLFRRASASSQPTQTYGNSGGGGVDAVPAGGGWLAVPGAAEAGPLLLPLLTGADTSQAKLFDGDRESREVRGTVGADGPAFASVELAWKVAQERVFYGDLATDLAPFAEFYRLLHALVDSSPAADAYVGRTVGADSESVETGLQLAIPIPRAGRTDLLGLVLLRAIEPAYAQQLGLYVLDSAVSPGQSWDYALLADRAGAFGGSVDLARAWLDQDGATGEPRAEMDVDVAWLQGMKQQAAAPLPAVTAARAFALPVPTQPVDGGGADLVCDGAMTAGLRWLAPQIPDVVGLAESAGALTFAVERAKLTDGPVQAPKAPLSANTFGSACQFELAHAYPTMLVPPALTAGAPESDLSPKDAGYTPPTDWPQFRLGFVDTPLDEGWYAWRVTATDLFGRRSEPSAPAAWHSWPLAEGEKKPWYTAKPWVPGEQNPWYVPDPWTQLVPSAQGIIHPSAVGLFDKVAPPAPRALWAQVVDPEDPLVLKDQAYRKAYKGLTSKPKPLFLRMRWQWTLAEQRQAPDASESRVYVRPGLVNTRQGQLTWMLPGSRPMLVVGVDISMPAAQADSLDGALLRVNGRAFEVASSEAMAGGLRLNLKLPPGQHDAAAAEARIRPGLRCTLTLQPYHMGWSAPAAVRDGSWQRALTAPMAGTDDQPANLALQPLRLCRADLAAGDPPSADLLIGADALVASGIVHLGGDKPLHAVDVNRHVLVLQAAEADEGAVLPLDPLVNGLVLPLAAVDAAGRRLHLTAEAAAKLPPEWQAGQFSMQLRWAVGELAKHYDVWWQLDEQKLLPVPPANQGKAWMQVLVTTADDKIHTDDWLDKDSPGDPHGLGGVPGNEGEPAALQSVFRVRRELPPAPKAVWPSPCRASETDADGRSFFSVRWQKAGLSVRILRASADSVFQADYALRKLKAMGGDAVDVWLAANWSTGDKPGFAGVRGTYEGLEAADKQKLASGAGVARVFSAVHSAPLGDAAWPDALGPDDPVGAKADPDARCAFVDTLPGRMPGLWFYRLQAIDAAGNVSAPGEASPPVEVVEVFVPSAPVIVEAYAGTPAMREELAALRVAEEDFASGKSKVKPQAEWELLEKYSGMVTLVWSVPAGEVGKIGGWSVYGHPSHLDGPVIIGLQPADTAKKELPGAISYSFASNSGIETGSAKFAVRAESVKGSQSELSRWVVVR